MLAKKLNVGNSIITASGCLEGNCLACSIQPQLVWALIGSLGFSLKENYERLSDSLPRMCMNSSKQFSDKLYFYFKY